MADMQSPQPGALLASLVALGSSRLCRLRLCRLQPLLVSPLQMDTPPL
jgi:hypothetical protein